MAAARVRALSWPIAAAAAALLAAGCVPLKGTRPTSLVFFCKGAEAGVAQSWRVPAGVTQLTIDVLGAQGGSALDGQGGAWPGGDGGRATATIATTPGETLDFYVGCKGGNNAGVNPGAGGAGFLTGGSGGDAAPWIGAIGGGGGGISVVFRGGVTPVIGAGSGGGAAFGAPGGAGGGIAGEDGGAPAGAPERAGRGGGSPGFGMGGEPGGHNHGGPFGCACIAGPGGDHPDDPDSGVGHGGGGGGGGTRAGGGGGYGAGPGPGGGGGGTGFGPPGTVFQTGVQVGHGVIVVRLVP